MTWGENQPNHNRHHEKEKPMRYDGPDTPVDPDAIYKGDPTSQRVGGTMNPAPGFHPETMAKNVAAISQAVDAAMPGFVENQIRKADTLIKLLENMTDRTRELSDRVLGQEPEVARDIPDGAKVGNGGQLDSLDSRLSMIDYQIAMLSIQMGRLALL